MNSNQIKVDLNFLNFSYKLINNCPTELNISKFY